MEYSDNHRETVSKRAFIEYQENIRTELVRLDLHLTRVDDRTRRQFDVLNATLMLLIKRDNKEYYENASSVKEYRQSVANSFAAINAQLQRQRLFDKIITVVFLVVMSAVIGSILL